MPPPTFSSTRIIGATYITHHAPVPPVVIKPPLTTMGNSLRPKNIPTFHYPAPLRAGTVASTKVGYKAKDIIARAWGRVRGFTIGGSATSTG